MTDLKEIARKIGVLQRYTQETGTRTSRSQAELLSELDGEQTVAVLEMAQAELRSPLHEVLSGEKVGR
jgi:hypothetical protein